MTSSGLACASSLLFALASCAPGSPSDPTGQEGRSCIHDVISIPILSTAGGLIIPVQIDGQEAAALISPRVKQMFVIDPTGLNLRLGEDSDVESLSGDSTGQWTTIDRLVVGSATMRRARAVLLHNDPLPPVDGRHIAVSIGYDILSAAETLIDLPHKRLVLFQYRTAGCPDVQTVFQGRSYSTPLHEADAGHFDAVDAVINGHVVDMQINTGSNASIISRYDANNVGISDQDLLADPQVRTQDDNVRLGHRHLLNSLSVAGYSQSPFRINVLRRINYNPLGLDFFRNKVVLLDYAGDRLIFQVSGNTRLGPVEDGPGQFGTLRSKDVHVEVKEDATP